MSGLSVLPQLKPNQHSQLQAEPYRSSRRGVPWSVIVVAMIVFLANAGLLVLQLTAGRLLVPFIGSSLETWTAVIGVFLMGIAFGNGIGGRLADRAASRWTLALALVAGAVACLGMIGWPRLLAATGWHQQWPLRIRILILTFIECFPAGFVLSLLTPTAIKLGLANRESAGRAAGRVYAIGTLGCLLGNYLTGFYLIPNLTINAIVLATAAALALAAVPAVLILGRSQSPIPLTTPTVPAATTDGATFTPLLTMPQGIVIVAVCSFCGMALELTATRMLAMTVGVSLYTWTGIIGVMLAGTALGNWLGGRLASGPQRLTVCLLLASAAALSVLVTYFTGTQLLWFESWSILPRILGWTFTVFFPVMVLLGTISPQVIRLTVRDVATAGRTAGRLYAWSTFGAILGTFATGTVLISSIGMFRLVLGCAIVLAVLMIVMLGRYITRAVLNGTAVTLGLAVGGIVMLTPQVTRITAETNYFTLRVLPDAANPKLLRLQQDLLVHSIVNLDDPTYLHYTHERVQMQLLAELATEITEPNVLVIGGGGYTFPRAAKTHLPKCNMDVVEIDPGVTRVSYSHLGLNPELGIRSYLQDGRQFIVEQAKRDHYDLISLDAVNDLSVPSHLLTTEFHAAVKQTLRPHGQYLITVIDTPESGHLWRATWHTLRQSFEHVEVLTHDPIVRMGERTLLILYASDRPFRATGRTLPDGRPGYTIRRIDSSLLKQLLAAERPLVLRDQFAPVDNLMTDVFRASKPNPQP